MEEMFSDFGKVLALEFKGDFAFVEYDDGHSAEQAVKKLDGARLSGRRLIVEPFRYRGNDPRYRRPPPKNIKRGEYRVIVTNLGPDTKAQELKDWCESEKLDSITIADVYSRHDNSKVNEGVVEFRNRDDFEYCLRHLNNVKFGDHVVRVFEEREYNRRKLKAHERDRLNDTRGSRQILSSRSFAHNQQFPDDNDNDNHNERSRSPSQHNNDRRSNRNSNNNNNNNTNNNNNNNINNNNKDRHSNDKRDSSHEREFSNGKHGKRHRHSVSNSHSRSRSRTRSRSHTHSRSHRHRPRSK